MRHFSKKHILYQMCISLFSSLFFAFYLYSPIGKWVGEEDPDIKEDILLAIGVYIFVFIISSIIILLKWKVTQYSLGDQEIVLKTGILFRRKKIVRYDRINAIDYNQNIIQRLFKIKVLSIDSGSTINTGSEISIVESDESIDSLKKEIQRRMNQDQIVDFEEKEQEILYQYTDKQKFLYTILQTIAVFFFLLFFYVSSSLITIYIGENILWIVLLSVFIIIVFLVFVFSYIYKIIKYYDYKVYLEDNYLIIKHGIIYKYNNMLKLDRIRAVSVEEGLIKRIFGFASIKLEVVGYGGVSNENGQKISNNFYIPLCRRTEVNKYISQILPGIDLEIRRHKPPIRAYRYFISLNVLWTLIAFVSILPILIIINNQILSIIYMLLFSVIAILVVIQSILAYKISGINYDKDKFIVYHGDYIKKSLIIPMNNIIALEKTDTYLRNRRDIASFKIHFFNTASKNTVRAHLLESFIFNELANLIDQ